MASNAGNWQWVAGTGHNTRPNRVMNPLRQARRFDPAGDYVRRHVPELAGLPPAQVHIPWRLDAAARRRLGYPDPLVELLYLTERRSSPRHRLAHPGPGAGLSDGGRRQPGQVVRPAGDVPGLLGRRRVAVLEVDAGAGALGGEPYLHRAGPGAKLVRHPAEQGPRASAYVDELRCVSIC